jgi:phage-related protein
MDKPIDWRGSSLKDIKDDAVFSVDARKEAGHQLSQVQAGLEPDDWKPFDVVGPGTKEIRINLNDGWFRVMYVAKPSMCCIVLKRKPVQPASTIKKLRLLAIKRSSKKGICHDD